MTDATLADVVALSGRGPAGFHFSDELWVRTIYDFAVAYRQARVSPAQLLKSLVPLYLGRTASFVMEAAEADSAAVERIIAALAAEYVRQKDYLVRRWSARSREA